MNLDKIKEFFSSLGTHDLPAGGAALAGMVLLVLVFKTGKVASRFVLFIIAVALLAGAWWWHQNK